MQIDVGQTQNRKISFFKRLWQRLQNLSDAMDVTETSLLAERVEQIERQLRELDANGKGTN